jgi:hypothetical protein
LATTTIPNMDHENHHVAQYHGTMGFPTTDEFLDIFIKHFSTDFKMNSFLNDADQLENR